MKNQKDNIQKNICIERYGESRRVGKLYDKINKKIYNLQEIFHLIQQNTSFTVFHKKANITNEVSEKAIRKYWTKSEIKSLKDNFGSISIEVLRKDFLPKKSTGQIRFKADELSLTIDRRWQDHEITALTAMRKSGLSYIQISKILQRPSHACQVKAHKLGITHSGDSSQDLENVENQLYKYSKVPSITKGKIAEDLSSIKLLKNGFDVFVPYTPNHQTDLIVVKHSKVAKLQVKSCIWDHKTQRFRVPLERKSARTNERKFYDKNDIDFFILYCLGIDAIYIVPFEICKSYKSANLYPHRPKLILDGKFDWEQFRDSYILLENFLKA